MNHTNGNRWLEHEGDSWLTWLHEKEEVPKRAMRGIWRFLVMKIPEECRRLLIWLEEQGIYACKVALRATRIAGFALAWLLIVGGPLAVCPGIITGAWGALALAGSYWGLQRQIGKQRVTITEVKGVGNGR